MLAIGCATNGEDKGEEDDIPIDGKDDSFVNPSNHGALAFEIDNHAAFTDREGFHMWTFSLTGSAKVVLATELGAPNLDTVMYLYKRTSPSASWGAAIKKNDDAGEDTAASRISMSLGKGEYRVLIKAFKRTQRGAFSVNGTCSGAGCPDPGAVCDVPESLPVDTDYGGSCGPKLAAIYANASVDIEQSLESSLDDRCSAPPLQRLAIDYYASYFDGELEPDTPLSVDTRVLGGSGGDGGTLIDVGDGGDESSITFVFDTDDTLVALYQHNQSPDVRFYCREASKPRVSLPNVEDCVGALVGDIPHDVDEELDVALSAAPNNLPAGLGAEVRAPMQRYATSNNTSASTKLNVTGAGWDLFDGRAVRIDITATSKPRTSYLATPDMVLLEAPTGRPAALVCQ